MAPDSEQKAESQTGTAVTERIAGTETKCPGYSLYIWLSDDKLECRCSYVPHDQGSMITREELAGFLKMSGVKEGLISEALEDFTVRAAAGQPQTMVLLAYGTAAVTGTDGWLSYIAKPSVTVTHVVDDASSIDMHNVQDFINVMPGDEIARIVPAEPGSAGMTVTGKVIPVRPGKPLNLKVGKNINVLEDGLLLVAATAGRVCVASGEILVAKEYVVVGDVNFRVGSIVFNGFVEVRGDILDGFSVTAVDGLRVSGNIGDCRIKSDGDISFCGMDGQEQGTIECGGSLTCNFIHESHVTCGGNLTADVELHGCRINVLGRIVVNKGAIVGGSYTALGGISTKKIGSPASVKTTLRAGFDYRDIPELERISAELETNLQQLEQAASFDDIEAIRATRGDLTNQLMEIHQRTDERAHPKINVKLMLYDNTFLRLGMATKVKVDEMAGPFSVIENTIEGGLRFLPFTSLDVLAKDIERAVLMEEALKASQSEAELPV